ncbi:Radical SAM domain protein [Desulfatibacillum aliphaticivorans]|uniref:Radical SAM domain protein n=1 Tax=Desulfatibacillum aliphaticivorans TaxID=218208 RepID=B8FF35_DESAL|nr:radical SAM protein [Desulfatibacillum aliphaticivorans]ACL03852.1 Radical SAM domain protein [Desulfatibacillum aliphaticivorans]
MRLAFVFNPFSYKLHEENLRIVQRYFGLFPPLSMSWVAGIAERAGHDVTFIDARTLRLTPDEVVARLKAFRPDMVGFMMTTYMFRETLQWIRHVKENLPRVRVIVGGYNLRVYPEESVMPPEIDYGCFNSAYYTVPGLLEALENNHDLSDVPGLIYKQGTKVIQTEYGPEPHFNDYPNPARHLLPNELYAEFPTERKNFTVMVTSKGCPMNCLFCEARSTPYNPRSIQTVVDEIQECYDVHGVREIDIFDYEFLVDRKRAMGICEEIIRRDLDILWACRARIDSLDEDLLARMKESGCGRVYLGIESGLQEMLDRVNKGITIEQVRRAVDMTKAHGIKTLGFFMTGLPGETRQTVKETLKFATSLGLDYVQFSKTTAKPLTSMWHDMVKESGYDYWKEYILGNAEEAPLPRPWTELSNDEIDRLTKKAYQKFHSRPFFLLKHALAVRSFDEFKRKFLAWLEMQFRQEAVSRPDEHFVAYEENRRKRKKLRKKS